MAPLGAALPSSDPFSLAPSTGPPGQFLALPAPGGMDASSAFPALPGLPGMNSPDQQGLPGLPGAVPGLPGGMPPQQFGMGGGGYGPPGGMMGGAGFPQQMGGGYPNSMMAGDQGFAGEYRSWCARSIA